MLRFLHSIWFPIFLGMAVVFTVCKETTCTPASQEISITTALPAAPSIWHAPDIQTLGIDTQSKLILYGRELFSNTATFLGPRGSIANLSNGMNCQNCHLDAGTRPYANALAAVAATYPIFKARSGRVESIEFRINDCMQRSMNGKTLDSLSREMRAMVAYIKWVGKGVPVGKRPSGAGTEELTVLNRAADPLKGKALYEQQCQRCHNANGDGQLRPDSMGYVYPPLWGPHSFNVSAGMYRISKLAGYIKNNMPFGMATYQEPKLTSEESWDLAAFIASQPRPVKKFTQDWPDISKKSFDYPFGPFTDSFTAIQHKYGPFTMMQKTVSKK